ncbi:bpX6 domain-containing protein [Yinghuangia seranimata]|uniref:bpX6 domain-containing protein n=1 Tax=Yinghuangia seranimata TaxID=408067 RepID=UPI00248C9498|nr:bpX6 domain-containing protein [Yinghuangia seranimata]MDI2126621.1 bpX6 domain-containing protein [Yinghuangia seranimata]
MTHGEHDAGDSADMNRGPAAETPTPAASRTPRSDADSPTAPTAPTAPGHPQAYRGRVTASGFLLDPSVVGDADVAARVRASWQPGAELRELPDGRVVLRLPEASDVRAELAPGTPLVAYDGALVVPGLPVEAGDVGHVVYAVAGARRSVAWSSLPRVPVSRWLDVSALPVRRLAVLDGPAPEPDALPGPPSPDEPDLRDAARVRGRGPRAARAVDELAGDAAGNRRTRVHWGQVGLRVAALLVAVLAMVIAVRLFTGDGLDGKPSAADSTQATATASKTTKDGTPTSTKSNTGKARSPGPLPTDAAGMASWLAAQGFTRSPGPGDTSAMPTDPRALASWLAARGVTVKPGTGEPTTLPTDPRALASWLTEHGLTSSPGSGGTGYLDMDGQPGRVIEDPVVGSSDDGLGRGWLLALLAAFVGLLALWTSRRRRAAATGAGAGGTGSARTRRGRAHGGDFGAPGGPEWAPRPPGALSRLANRIAVGVALSSPARGYLEQRHERYVRELTDAFRQGRWDDALRDAIAIGDGPAAGTMSLRVPARRVGRLVPTPQERLARTQAFGDPTLFAHLSELYRDAGRRLEAEGRVDEAAFTYADLLGSPMEAVSLLERHGRPRDAAVLAEGRRMAPELVVRLWWKAGERRHAVDVARRTGTFATAVARAEAVDLALAAELRAAWVAACQEAGDHMGAVEAAWPDRALRGTVRADIAAGMTQGGQRGARLTAYFAVAAPAAEARAAVAPLLAPGTDPDPDELAWFLLTLATLDGADPVWDRELATLALRALTVRAGALRPDPSAPKPQSGSGSGSRSGSQSGASTVAEPAMVPVDGEAAFGRVREPVAAPGSGTPAAGEGGWPETAAGAAPGASALPGRGPTEPSARLAPEALPSAALLRRAGRSPFPALGTTALLAPATPGPTDAAPVPPTGGNNPPRRRVPQVALTPSQARDIRSTLVGRADPLVADDLGALRTYSADLPQRTPLHVAAADQSGTLPVFDAAALPGGDVLLAHGEAGVRLVDGSGRTRARWDVPAHRLVLADHAGTALLAADRNAVQEVHRLDLATRAVRFWAVLADRIAVDSFDGAQLVTLDGQGVAVLDTTSERPRVLWRELAHETALRPGMLTRTADACAALVLDEVRGHLEVWRWSMPDWSLRERRPVQGELTAAAVSAAGAVVTVRPASEERQARVIGRRRLPYEASWSGPNATDWVHLLPESGWGVRASGEVTAVVEAFGNEVTARIRTPDAPPTPGTTGTVSVRFPDADPNGIGIREHNGLLTVWDRTGRVVVADARGNLKANFRTRA